MSAKEQLRAKMRSIYADPEVNLCIQQKLGIWANFVNVEKEADFFISMLTDYKCAQLLAKLRE